MQNVNEGRLLKRFRINACLDDVKAKTQHIKVACEGKTLKKCAGLQALQGDFTLLHYLKRYLFNCQ